MAVTYTAYELSGGSVNDTLTSTHTTLSPKGSEVVNANGDGKPVGVLGGGTNTFRYDGAVFTYKGTAVFGGEQGFIAYDASNGKLYFFTDSKCAPPACSKVECLTVPKPGQSSGAGEYNAACGATGCFVKGTKIATPSGEAAVETLSAGDLVKTADGAFRPIRWVGYSVISLFGGDPVALRPIRIRAGSLGENTPARDLLVSPGHAVLVGSVLAHASSLVNRSTIVFDEETPIVFTYYHLELDQHDLLLAEGAPAESFIEVVTEMDMDNWSERALIASEAPSIEMPYPRVKSPRQLPEAVRRRLAEREAALTARPRVAA